MTTSISSLGSQIASSLLSKIDTKTKVISTKQSSLPPLETAAAQTLVMHLVL